MANILDKQFGEIQQMYYDFGWSGREISEKLEVGLDAVYRFMRKNHLSRRKPSDCNRILFARKEPTFLIPTEFTAEEERLRIIGTALYWSEGGKRGKIVDFANSDVEMCLLFIRYLRQIFRVDESKLRGFLYCHKNQNPHAITKFWSKRLNIPTDQFTKPYIREYVVNNETTRKKKSRPRRMEYGVIHIRYGDLKLLNQLLTWIEELKIMGRYQSG